MKLKLVSFELAKKLKEVGFDEICDVYYNFIGNLHHYTEIPLIKGSQEFLNVDYAPTLALVQMWLREKYCIDVEILRCGDVLEPRIGFKYSIYGEQAWDYSDVLMTKYDQSLETGILEAIKLIKK